MCRMKEMHEGSRRRDIYEIEPIAYIHTDFKEKFGIPRQSGLVPELRGRIEFLPAYSNPDAVRGLEEYSHLWLIWGFSESRVDSANWQPTVRPPRLGGSVRKGVFATRSPYRPNSLGLSSVTIEDIQVENGRPYITVGGADLLDGTPIYDIKPYIPSNDCHTDALGGFSAPPGQMIDVSVQPGALDAIPEDTRSAVVHLIEEDPRPAYDKRPGLEYGMLFGDWDIRFRESSGTLEITGAVPSVSDNTPESNTAG